MCNPDSGLGDERGRAHKSMRERNDKSLNIIFVTNSLGSLPAIDSISS